MAALLRRYFETHAPPSVRVEVRELGRAQPVYLTQDGPPMRAAAEALEATFGHAPAFAREGGSIPVVQQLQSELGLSPVMMGFGLESDGIHAPDEHFALERFALGIEAVIRFLHVLADSLTAGTSGTRW